MIPYKDDNPTTHFPVITILLIALNILVFLYQSVSGPDTRAIVYTYGAIPYNLLHGTPGDGLSIPITLFTSMFLHGGIFHLAGNMLYLWIFGNNIEDRLGIFRFILFYLLCGIIATYTHAITESFFKNTDDRCKWCNIRNSGGLPRFFPEGKDSYIDIFWILHTGY